MAHQSSFVFANVNSADERSNDASFECVHIFGYVILPNRRFVRSQASGKFDLLTHALKSTARSIELSRQTKNHQEEEKCSVLLGVVQALTMRAIWGERQQHHSKTHSLPPAIMACLGQPANLKKVEKPREKIEKNTNKITQNDTKMVRNDPKIIQNSSKSNPTMF